LTAAPRRLLGLSLAAVLAVPAAVHGAAAPEGRILGRVIDRTAPQHPVARQVVRLTIIERGVSSEHEAVSDTGGTVRFSGLPVGGIRVFVLSTDYRGVPYASDKIVLTDATPVRTANLVVYEPSSDRSVVRATLAFAVVDIARGAVRVSTIQRFENPTDRAILISPEDPLAFPLPPGAGSVNALTGWRDPHIGRGRITDVFPLRPGTAQVAYAYTLEARESHLAVPWSLLYGAEDVEMLVAEAGVGAAADGLRAQGAVDGPRGRYQRFGGGPIPSGGEVVLRLRGIPLGHDPWPGSVAAGLGVILCVGLVGALRRRSPAV
jgi:hypothetical protein